MSRMAAQGKDEVVAKDHLSIGKVRFEAVTKVKGK